MPLGFAACLSKNCNTGQKMWDPLAVIHAVEGDSLFSLSPRGTVSLTPECATIFMPSSTGRSATTGDACLSKNCRYQQPGTADWNAAMLEKIRNSATSCSPTASNP